jgi:hypothetical protein
MRAVRPDTGADEVMIAEEQHQYKTLVGAVYHTEEGVRIILTRWRLDDDERAKIAAGEDIYLGLMTFNGPLQPIIIGVDKSFWDIPVGE